MTDKNNPLKELLVKETQPLNLQELVDILKPFILINDETREIELLPEFGKLSNEDAMLVYLAAAKARKLLFKEMEEKLSPSEIIKKEIMPAGSVKTTLKRLYDSGEIKAENSKYYLPNYRIRFLKSRLKPS
jgi:hypothetical protein